MSIDVHDGCFSTTVGAVAVFNVGTKVEGGAVVRAVAGAVVRAVVMVVMAGAKVGDGAVARAVA